MNDIEIHSSTIPDLSVAPRARLFTNWGTVVYVDTASGELRHGPPGSPANAIFVADPASSEEEHRGWLMHDTGSALEPIVCLTGHSWSAASGELEETSPLPTPFEFVHLERGILGFRSGGNFLCALPDGRITLSSTHCSIWECFLASEDWCTPPRTAAAAQDLRRPGNDIEWRQIAAWIPEPMHRVQSRNTAATKIIIWGHTQWSHGRVYYDVSKALTERGYVVDLLDWTVGQGWKMPHLLSYYDFFLTALNGVGTLIDTYRVPADRIIGLSHHERDIRMLIDEKGVGIFDELAGYGVVGYQLYDASAIFGVRRSPLVVQLGVNNAEFGADLPERLGTVGYASSYSHVTPEGVEMKRGDLAEAAARDAGLEFKIAGSVGGPMSFHDMPAFYRSVDAVLVSSLTEGAQLPIREAAAAGRLVISTPVGDFPLRAAQGMGIVAPIEAHKYTRFVADTLKYYKDNPATFVKKCHEIQAAARSSLDWQYLIDDWGELIEAARVEAVQLAGQSTGPDEPEAQIVTRKIENHPLVDKIEFALERAIAAEGKLDRNLLSMVGMSGRKYRLFINNLVGSLENARYLEVGVWAGSTLCSAIYQNQVRATAIDNWSLFYGPFQRFFQNLARFKGPEARVSFIEADFRSVDFATLGKFNVYLFDGPHDAIDQYDGLIRALPALDDNFVFIVDDWNWEEVRDGTHRAIHDAALSINFQADIRTTQDNSHPNVSGADSSWHNGYFIAVLSKNS